MSKKSKKSKNQNKSLAQTGLQTHSDDYSRTKKNKSKKHKPLFKSRHLDGIIACLLSLTTATAVSGFTLPNF